MKPTDSNSQSQIKLFLFKYFIEGCVDRDYTGSIQLIVSNGSTDQYSIQRGDRLAQVLFQKIYDGDLAQTDLGFDSDRGNNAFGFTGR